MPLPLQDRGPSLACPSHGLPKKNRIGRRKIISQIISDGNAAKSSFFTIKFRRNEDPKLCRIAVITGKKLGNAVLRNKIRRRTKELFRLLMPVYSAGFDLVVFPTKDVANAGFAELQKEYQSCLKSLDLA